MARLYADENFPFRVTAALRALGHDVVTIQERGRAHRGTPDPEVLRLAIAEKRAVLTLNRDHFHHLHRSVPAHAGIVTCTRDDDRARLAARIDEALHALPDLRGQLVRVTRPNR